MALKKEKIARYPFISFYEKEILKVVPTSKEKLYIRKKIGVKGEKVILSVGQYIGRVMIYYLIPVNTLLNNKIIENYPVAYACINKNDKIRKQSSSGGVFTFIAERIIANNGVVVRACFNGEFDVVHSWTDSLDGLSNFRGSKYVQSRIGDTYNQVKDFLKQGRQVLFSGTPYQIAGLRSYLRKDYDGLICIDIICHDVPSPKVWQLYKLNMEKLYQARIKRITFRRKNCGGSYSLYHFLSIMIKSIPKKERKCFHL